MPILATLKDLDARIHVLERELAAMKTKRNSLLPTHRLPPEIIADVVELVQHGCRSVDEMAPWEVYDDRWCDITLNGSDLCIQRASHLPLFIRDSTGGSLAILPRAQTLEIRDGAVTEEILNVPKPALHALHVARNEDADEGEYFALRMMSHESTALAYFGLSNVSLGALPALHSLRRLELNSVGVGDGLDGLFQLLSQVTLVEVLCFCHLAFDEARTHPMVKRDSYSVRLGTIMVR